MSAILETGPAPAATGRSRVARRVTAATLRPITQLVPPGRGGIMLTRLIISSSMAGFGRIDPLVGIEAVDTPTAAGRVKGEWLRPPGHLRDDTVILYLHGSAFVACSPKTHRGLMSQLSSRTKLAVFACQYRRAPRHRFPKAADDALAAYRFLKEQGFTRIVLAGDSAGGHIAVDLALGLQRRGEQAPTAIVLLSPLYDLTFTLAAERERRRRDPMISARRARALVEVYTRGVDASHEGLRLAVREAPPLPPVLIQAGGAEMLSADAERLADDLRAAGGRCELQIWPDQMHVFQALPRLIPEARPAMKVASQFILRSLAEHNKAADQTTPLQPKVMTP